MGHQRLHEVPTTRKWEGVVKKITREVSNAGSQGAPVNVAKIAKHLLKAAEGGLVESINDPGVESTVYHLTQIVLAARQDNWQAALSKVGIKLDRNATPMDFTAEVQRVIDEDVNRRGRPSTLGGLARQAAGESLAGLLRDEAVSLFGGGREELKQAVKKLSTKAGFSDLGQKFFGNFIARYLDSYASKIIPTLTGKQGFRDVQDISDFKQALFVHCYQSAKIVHDFSGEWYSKTEWERGIDRQNTGQFVAVALKKLQKELGRQREAFK